ncbi:MAG: hypothetical protein P8K08_02600 [Fuerstiella sp.]|nr:hypothetical protein [Fuerstiella sp.]
MLRTALALLLSTICSSGLAGVIRSPTAVSQNTLGNLTSDFDAENLINQGGLSSSFSSGVTDFDAYSSSHAVSEAAGFLWQSASSTISGVLDFDLGESLTIFQLALWTGGPTIHKNRDIKEFKVFTSADSSFTTATNVGEFTGTEYASNPLPAGVFDLVDTVARFVRLEIVSNHGGPVTRAGELAFDTSASSVPEPSHVTLLTLSVIGCAVRAGRRRKSRFAC